MGLFDLFGSRESREQAALRRLGQKITQTWGPQENRQKAMEQAEALKSHAGWKALCLRFTIRSEVGIQDDEEKEQARGALVRAGPVALPAVKEFLSEQEEGVAWGLRVLAELAPAEDVTATVLGLLQRLSREYTRDPEKKLVLLSWLREHPTLLEKVGPGGPGVQEAVVPLLEDFVDDVRIGAARTLAVAAPGEAGREALIALLLRDRDNARVRGEVLQALHDLGADVKGHRNDVEALLVEPYFLDRDGNVKKRGT